MSILLKNGVKATINDVKFSPDSRYLASASFDKSVKLWSGKNGQFICAFRGHVRPVYSIAWSLDSRMIVSGSSDSTLKLFEISTRKLLKDLPVRVSRFSHFFSFLIQIFDKKVGFLTQTFLEKKIDF